MASIHEILLPFVLPPMWEVLGHGLNCDHVSHLPFYFKTPDAFENALTTSYRDYSKSQTVRTET